MESETKEIQMQESSDCIKVCKAMATTKMKAFFHIQMCKCIELKNESKLEVKTNKFNHIER